MRFLCLHGIGTTISILEAQLASLRYHLGPTHTYEFVEGSLPWPPAPGIEDAFGKQEPEGEESSYYSYFNASPPSILKAVNDLVEFLDEEGPFDGIIGFSQGGALATTLIAAEERELLTAKKSERLKCAILLSCGLPWDYSALQAGESRRLTPAEDGVCIRIPTAHFWGENDEMGYPGNHDVTLLCEEGMRVEVVHMAGHGVPSGSKAKELEEMVKAVEKTVEKGVFVNQ